ncbi:MAG: PQQ-binding-like beta-propeller repeat protein [Pirellulales bacterium]|nr:PQQ-binding-like beta-propeller repeat protein [Pirellulales bacterium]
MRCWLISLLAVSCYPMLLPAPASAADNWPQWRGPGGRGIAAQGDYPVKFSAAENVAWKVELPGRGSSTPIVWDELVFVTSMIGDQDGVTCYTIDGEQKWQKTFGPGREGKHRNGTGSNPTPATDGKHVVLYYKSGRVVCLDLQGEERWQINLQEKYGKDTLWWDLGTSPIIVGHSAVIAVMHAGEGYLVALDLESGKVAWKRDRTYQRPEEADQAYTTPHLANIDGRDVIVVWGADHLTGHDAATGAKLWEAGGFNPNDEGFFRVIASQAIGDGIAVVPYARGKNLAGVKLGGQGDATQSRRLWTKEGSAGADVPTPIVRQGKVYVLSDGGDVVCRDLKTGDELWSGKLPRHRDKYYASPILAGDRLYCAREDGMVFVVDVSQEFKLLGENDMGERIIATPAPVRDSLLLRGEQHLLRIVGDGAAQVTAAE